MLKTSAAEVRATSVLFYVMDVVGNAVVVVDMADVVEMHLVMAARAAHAVAVDHPVQPLMERGAAFRAAHPDFFPISCSRGFVMAVTLRPAKARPRVDKRLREFWPYFLPYCTYMVLR